MAPCREIFGFYSGSIITFLHMLAGLPGTAVLAPVCTPVLAPGYRSASARSGTACQARCCTAAWGCSCTAAVGRRNTSLWQRTCTPVLGPVWECSGRTVLEHFYTSALAHSYSFHARQWSTAFLEHSGTVVVAQESIFGCLCSGILVSEPVLVCSCIAAWEYSCTSAWAPCCTAPWPPGCTVSWGCSGRTALAPLSTAWSARSGSLLSALAWEHSYRFLLAHSGTLALEQLCTLVLRLVLGHSGIVVLEHFGTVVLARCCIALLGHFCILVSGLDGKLGQQQHHIHFLLHLHVHLHVQIHQIHHHHS